MKYPILFFLLIACISSKFLEKKVGDEFDNIIAIIRGDNEEEFRNALELLKEKGGMILINSPSITITDTEKIKIEGDLPGGILGLQQPNEQYPIFNFIGQENKIPLGKSAFEIYGSNKYLRYIIVEHSGGAGIYIKGKNNTLNHVVTRYNNWSGVLVDIDADNTIISHCFSYRNFGATTFGRTADGYTFYAGNNIVVEYSYAWENSDRGFRAGDTRNRFSPETISFEHCASWNNGNFDVFIGKFDYDNGKTLDKDLWVVKNLIESDPSFEQNYKNKKFSIQNAQINGQSAETYMAEAVASISGDGFELGEEETSYKYPEKNSRIINTCASFDNIGSAFIKRNEHKFIINTKNCVGFNSQYNYYYNNVDIDGWQNNWSWAASKGNQIPSGIHLSTPEREINSQKSFYSVRDAIIKNIMGSQFPEDTVNFDSSISNLKN